MLLHHILSYWQSHSPDKAALIFQDQELSYRELYTRSQRLAVSLRDRLDVKKGDRIGVLSSNCTEMVELLFAISQLGAIFVPMNIRLTASELEYIATDSGFTTLFFGEQQKELAESLLALRPAKNPVQFQGSVTGDIIEYETLQQADSDRTVTDSTLSEETTLMLIYTSGTTGHPKGAILSHDNNVWNCIAGAHTINIQQNDRAITILPLFHIGGWGLFLLPTLYQGGTVVIVSQFDPVLVFETVRKHEITVFMGVPTIFNELLKHPDFNTETFKSCRLFISGGAPCPTVLIEKYQEAGFTFTQGFGMSETSPIAFLMRPEDSAQKVGSIGKTAICSRAKVVDPEGKELPPKEIGELVLKGNVVCRGYWNRPEATAEALRDGWLHSGDLAYYDEDGFFYIVDRKKDMIISGGENVYPAEVEAVLYRYEGIAEACVFGLNDPKWGETPVAAVVRKPGESFEEQELIDWCDGKLARYKQPKKILFRDELPKTASGKILKRTLKEMYSQAG